MADDVRVAGPADDRALCDLAAACPMRGPVSYCLEREPSFFALTALQGPRASVGVIDADRAGVIDAMATAVDVTRRVRGSEHPLRYLADLRVRPSARSQGLAGRLLRRAARDLARDRMAAFGLVLAGNRAMAPLVAEAGAELFFHPIARIRNYSVFVAPLGREHGAGEVVVRPARRGDAADLAMLWNRTARELAPLWDETSFVRHVDATPGLGFERIWIAERRGRPVAFVAAWDASTIKQLRLVSLSRGLRFLRPAFNRVAPWFGSTRMPADGDLVSFAYLAHACGETPADLRALILHVRRELAGSRCLYLDVAFDARDPLASALEGLPKTSIDFDMHWVTPRGIDPPELGPGPVFFDMSIV